MKKIAHLGILWSLLLLVSCVKEANSLVPNVPVYFSSELTDPRLSGLNNTPGVATVNGYGVKGIVIVRTFDGYFAYDRCSTINPTAPCQIQIDGFLGVDTCTGGKFNLISYGQPAKAPAKVALKRYNVSVGGNSITVSN